MGDTGEPLLPTGVNFVGSIPFSSAEEVFTKVCAAVPGRVQSIPDGETGVRYNWIEWQRERFSKEITREQLGGIPLADLGDDPSVHINEDAVKPTLYDPYAVESYKSFVKLREQGIIPKDVRFQVALPTPMNVVGYVVKPELALQVEPIYEKRILDALATILETVPAEDLALQWDIPFEVLCSEYERGNLAVPFFQPYFSPVFPNAGERIARLCEHIPAATAIGFHMCYGDYGHKHWIDPEDLGLMVDIANTITKAVPRPISWFHMPVPKSRDDEAFFAPLRNLDIGAECRLYLGLVHAEDEEGSRRKVKAAQSALRDFGIATECGFGRTPLEQIDSILDISKKLSQPIGPFAKLG